MDFAFDWLYRRLRKGYFLAYLGFEVLSALVITLGTVGLFTLYVDVSTAEFARVLLVAEGCVLLPLALGLRDLRRKARPLTDWTRRRGGEERAVEAWRTAVGLPLDLVSLGTWRPIALVAVPVPAYMVVDLGLGWYSFPILFVGALVAIAYAVVLHFFASELALRPVLREVAEHLPADFDGHRLGVPLRWKLLGALPLINVITGVVVSGLSTGGRASLQELGVDVVVAVLVAFTLSLELTLLVTKSLLGPAGDLLRATERVKAGDLSTRVPLVSGDELGRLAFGFNSMMRGLEEREALRRAFGSYVAPDVAERVLEEGELLEGEEVEVTVLFVDIRDFTAFAEGASAREAVAYLNDFFALAVPIVTRHGGHASKFVGDGLLAVFGTPERAPDHADRALRAARDIAQAVAARHDRGLRIGIGLNSGPVLAGTVGGGGRLEFTVIGDPVNVAARVEEVASETGDVVLITEATRCLLLDPDVELEPRGAIPLKGKSEPVPIYSAWRAPDERLEEVAGALSAPARGTAA